MYTYMCHLQPTLKPLLFSAPLHCNAPNLCSITQKCTENIEMISALLNTANKSTIL